MKYLRVCHAINIIVLSYCRVTHQLGGYAVFSWLFELPRLLLRYREICICYERDLLHPMTPAATRFMWTYLPIFWHVFCTGPCLIWPMSLLLWRPQFSTLSIQTLVIFNCFGALFTFVNFVTYQHFPRYKLEDAIRSGTIKVQDQCFPSSNDAEVTPIYSKWVMYLGEKPYLPFGHYNSLSMPSPAVKSGLSVKLNNSDSSSINEELSTQVLTAMAIGAPVSVFMCLASFFAMFISKSANTLSLTSVSFANHLLVAFSAATLLLIVVNAVLMVCLCCQEGFFTGASKYFQWKIHLCAAALVLYLFSECATISVSYAHSSRSSHFYQMTLFGSIVVEMLIEWAKCSYVDRDRFNVLSFLRQPLPSALLIFTAVYIDAHSFGLISQTCGSRSFFFTHCDTEKDKQQTFMCMLLLVVVVSRSFFAHCFFQLITYRPPVNVKSFYANATNTNISIICRICNVAAFYGCSTYLFLVGPAIPLLNSPLENFRTHAIVLLCMAALFITLSLALWPVLLARWSQQWAIQSRLMVLGVSLWFASPPSQDIRAVCVILLTVSIVSLIIAEKKRVLYT